MTECVKPVHLPNHLSILTAHSGLLRTTLADQIGIVALKLHERFAVHDYQLKKILKTATQKPEDGVSLLISYIKGSQDHFDKFIQCLSDLGYTGLVQTITGTGSAALEIPETVPRTITNITVPSPTTPPTLPKPQVQRRKMPSASERKIESNFDYLVYNIREPIQLCERLYQKGVFNKTDIDTCRIIYEREGRRNATKVLLLTLFFRGDDVYDTFIQCLKECGDKSVADQMVNDDNQERGVYQTVDQLDEFRTGHRIFNKVVRGTMEPFHYNIWMDVHQYLVEQFRHALDLIKDTMFQHHIIDDKDIQQIEIERTRHKNDENGAEKLVEILGNRGESALPRIIEALKTINHDASEYLQARINGSTKRKCENDEWNIAEKYISSTETF